MRCGIRGRKELGGRKQENLKKKRTNDETQKTKRPNIERNRIEGTKLKKRKKKNHQNEGKWANKTTKRNDIKQIHPIRLDSYLDWICSNENQSHLKHLRENLRPPHGTKVHVAAAQTLRGVNRQMFTSDQNLIRMRLKHSLTLPRPNRFIDLEKQAF